VTAEYRYRQGERQMKAFTPFGAKEQRLGRVEFRPRASRPSFLPGGPAMFGDAAKRLAVFPPGVGSGT
jgi:hypothetical protein